MEVTRRDTMAIGGAAVISTLIPSISVASTNDLILGVRSEEHTSELQSQD